MVKMFIYQYTGETTPLFIEGKKYIGRCNKAGNTMAKCEKGYWIDVFNRKMTISKLSKCMVVLKEFFVPNHKKAIAVANYAVGDIFKIKGKEEYEEYRVRHIHFRHINTWIVYFLEPVLTRNKNFCATGGLNIALNINEMSEIEYLGVRY